MKEYLKPANEPLCEAALKCVERHLAYRDYRHKIQTDVIRTNLERERILFGRTPARIAQNKQSLNELRNGADRV